MYRVFYSPCFFRLLTSRVASLQHKSTPLSRWVSSLWSEITPFLVTSSCRDRGAWAKIGGLSTDKCLFSPASPLPEFCIFIIRTIWIKGTHVRDYMIRVYIIIIRTAVLMYRLATWMYTIFYLPPVKFYAVIFGNISE